MYLYLIKLKIFGFVLLDLRDLIYKVVLYQLIIFFEFFVQRLDGIYVYLYIVDNGDGIFIVFYVLDDFGIYEILIRFGG